MTDYSAIINALRKAEREHKKEFGGPTEESELLRSAASALESLEKENTEMKNLLPPVLPGQKVWKPDGTQGVVDSFYYGKTGVQRIFVMFRGGERINLKKNGIGRDVFLSPPEK